MSLFRAETRKRLQSLVQTTLDDFKDKDLTKGAAVQAALPKARKICEGEYDAVVCSTLNPMFRAALSRQTRGYTRQPSLMIGNVPLPYRIAVPPAEMAINPETVDDDAESIVWIVLHKATIAELRRHVVMRDAHIAGALTERDKVKAVLDMASSLTANENAIVGDVLRRDAA